MKTMLQNDIFHYVLYYKIHAQKKTLIISIFGYLGSFSLDPSDFKITRFDSIYIESYTIAKSLSVSFFFQGHS